MKSLHCKAKYAINLKPDCTLLDVGDLILLSNIPQPRMLIHALENVPFLLEYLTYRVINRTELCEFSFSAGPNYLAEIMLSC